MTVVAVVIWEPEAGVVTDPRRQVRGVGHTLAYQVLVVLSLSALSFCFATSAGARDLFSWQATFVGAGWFTLAFMNIAGLWPTDQTWPEDASSRWAGWALIVLCFLSIPVGISAMA